MIHLNIRHETFHEAARAGRERSWSLASVLIEVSTDGGGWRPLMYFISHGELGRTDVRAAEMARGMMEAWNYAGIEARATSWNAEGVKNLRECAEVEEYRQRCVRIAAARATSEYPDSAELEREFDPRGKCE